MIPTVRAAWLALAVGLAAGVGGVLLWESSQGPVDLTPTTPPNAEVPFAQVDTGQGWNSSGDTPDGSMPPFRVAELGSTTGAVVVGGTTDLCARVVLEPSNESAKPFVRFSASAGALPTPLVQTDSGGLACTLFEAPHKSGPVSINAVAELGNVSSAPARNLVEVVEFVEHTSDHEENASAPGPSGLLIVLAMTLAVVLSRAGRRN